MCSFKSSSHPLRTSSVSGIAQHRTYKLKFKIQTLQSAGKGNPWILSWWGIHSSFVQSKSFWGRSRHRELAEFWCWIVEPSHFPWPGCSEVVQHCLDTLGMSGTAQPSWIKAQGMGISPGTKNCSEMQERGIWAREISTLTFGTGIYSWNKEQQHHCNNGLIAAYLFFFFLSNIDSNLKNWIQTQFVPTQAQCLKLRCGCAGSGSLAGWKMCLWRGFSWGQEWNVPVRASAGLICYPESSHTSESALPFAPPARCSEPPLLWLSLMWHPIKLKLHRPFLFFLSGGILWHFTAVF